MTKQLTKPVFFKTPWNHDTDAETKESAADFTDIPTLTQQHQSEEADINTIVKRFGITGQLPTVPMPPSVQDFEEVFDMQDAMNAVAAAKNSFLQLPAEVRDAFGHDPLKFVNGVDTMMSETDEVRKQLNLANLRAMGLLVEPGPVADRTTLGDLLKAIKEGKLEQTGETPKGPPKE